MLTVIKKILQTPTPLELVVKELIDAHRSKLEAETALDYAANMVQYHTDRIGRLNNRLNEYKELEA
jgi:hypothetical protein